MSLPGYDWLNRRGETWQTQERRLTAEPAPWDRNLKWEARMGLLQEAENTAARLKAGLLGFQGSGKTLTAAMIALELVRRHGQKKTVAMFDTETGSDFLIPIFKEAGIKFLVIKSRAFRDLLTFFTEAEQLADVGIVDSVTHVWTEIRTAYETRKKKQGLDFRDWAPIKKEWQAFPDRLVNSDLHVLVCGRAGFEWEMETDSDGKKELVKAGVKMKAEGEFGFEPSLMLEMQRLPRSEEGITKDPATHGWNHRMIVLKDRTQQINGRVFDFAGDKPDPLAVYAAIEPHLLRLNIGGKQLGVDTSRTSEGLFESGESRSERSKQVVIALDEIIAAFIEGGYSGQSEAVKKRKLALMRQAFGTPSWAAVEAMKLEDLQAGKAKLLQLIEEAVRQEERMTA